MNCVVGKTSSGARKTSFRVAFLAGIVATSLNCALADQVSTVPNLGPFNVADGGEYTLVPDAPIAALIAGAYAPSTRDWVVPGSFQTFCVEVSEQISANSTYSFVLDDQTQLGHNVLTVGAAYLYQQFATGVLPYNYMDSPAGSRAGDPFTHYSAYELQRAIWYFMGEYAYDANNYYMNGMVAVPVNPFAADNGGHGVSVMNLWEPGQPKDAAHAHQDVLVYVVPEPGVFALAGLSAAALVVFRRRK